MVNRAKEATTWLAFWNSANPVYVNSHHRRLHESIVARDIAALVPMVEATVLDFGCGEASAAEHVADHCRKLILSDAAPTVSVALAERYCAHPKIAVIPTNELRLLLPDSIDLIIVNSVIQYLSREEFHQLLAMFRRLLKDKAAVVIGDVISPEQSVVDDIVDLLRFGFKGGFLIAALVGLARTFFSEYRQLRSTLGLSSYGEGDMLATLHAAGYFAERRRPNIGHNQRRMTFVARKVNTDDVASQNSLLAHPAKGHTVGGISRGKSPTCPSGKGS